MRLFRNGNTNRGNFCGEIPPILFGIISSKKFDEKGLKEYNGIDAF